MPRRVFLPPFAGNASGGALAAGRLTMTEAADIVHSGLEAASCGTISLLRHPARRRRPTAATREGCRAPRAGTTADRLRTSSSDRNRPRPFRRYRRMPLWLGRHGLAAADRGGTHAGIGEGLAGYAVSPGCGCGGEGTVDESALLHLDLGEKTTPFGSLAPQGPHSRCGGVGRYAIRPPPDRFRYTSEERPGFYRTFSDLPRRSNEEARDMAAAYKRHSGGGARRNRGGFRTDLPPSRLPNDEAR